MSIKKSSRNPFDNATQSQIEKININLPTWKLIRGENFLSYLGVHPKALEMFDYYTVFDSNQSTNIPQQHQNNFNKFKKESNLIEHIERLVENYSTAREYFIDRLSSKIESSLNEGKTNKVIFRTTDFKSHDMEHLIGGELFEVKERSPQMGNRGLGRYLDPSYRELFKWELEACRLAGSKNKIDLAIIFPLVREHLQLMQGIRIMVELGIIPTAIGMMIELPTNVTNVRDFLSVLVAHTMIFKETPIFLFGLADLTQMMLGASRESRRMSEVFDITDVGIRRAVSTVLIEASNWGVQCGIHSDTFENIAERDSVFASILEKSLSFLVEDHWIVYA